jgi:coproporphyrinogen III oxidase-like Fe-S oxidoreductase
MREELKAALDLAKTLPPDDLAAFLGELEQVRVTALARIAAPVKETKPDERVDIHEAARRLGVSKHYLYRHHRQMMFAGREGGKLVFSSAGMEAYIKQGGNSLTSRPVPQLPQGPPRKLLAKNA